MDLFFRLATLGLHVIRFVYWTTAEIQTNKQKPKTESYSLKKLTKRIITSLVGVILGAQLLGLHILPFQNNLLIQLSGFLLVLAGIILTIIARKTLGTNWTHAAEFQIRKNQALVTHGVYAKIRHPLYTGMFFAVFGAEIVAGSYLVVPFLIFCPLYFYLQARKEEKILIKQFGKEYLNYMKRSHMFLPYFF